MPAVHAMQDKNFIAFLVMSILLIFLWMTFFAPKPKPPTPGPGPVAGETVTPKPGSTASPTAATPAAPTPPAVPATPAAPPASAPGAAVPPLPAAPAAPAARNFTVRTEAYEIEFTSAGAAPVHWRLLKYPMEKCFPVRVVIAWPPIIKDPPCDRSPVDLVEQRLPAADLPFIGEVKVDDQTVPLSATWEPERTALDFQGGSTTDEVSFRTRLSDGRTLHKVFRFRREGYHVELIFKVDGTAPAAGAADIALFYVFDPSTKSGVPRWNYNGPIVFNGKAMQQLKPEDLLKQDTVAREGVNWAGFTTDYFLTALLAPGDSGLSYVVKFLGTEEERKNKRLQKPFVGWIKLSGAPDELKDGIAARATIYMGPKEKKILIAVRPSLQYAIDYGRLKIFVLPLIAALVWIEALVGNYGVAIIILTVILRMAMFPLTRKSQKSMKEIQKLQPEVQAIKEKYGDDRVKQQEEMQGLWRKHKINPAMGCLPMLVQFPVFFAFYKALLISIELRQAPFFGWIQDLGARDPLYIWPVLMGATQFITQKLTPTQMDPTQAKIFLAMPIVFTYILRDFPSGLLVYWTVQNIVGIGQQIYVNRTTT